MADPRGLQDADRHLTPAVLGTLQALDLQERDLAAAKLAETYARAIDQAKTAEAWADSVLRKVDRDSDLGDEVHALKVKLAAKVALSDLGPKLAGLLGELGGTPRGRSAIGKGQSGPPSRSSAALAKLRSVRDAG